ncbi:hypothetical protein EB52_02901 [Enterococcus faecalis]|nr:hypothetical protein EB52_02901 [Enterococcus faecalis]
MEEKFVVKVCHANGTFLGYVSEQKMRMLQEFLRIRVRH